MPFPALGAISFGQAELKIIGASVAGGLIAFYEIGYLIGTIRHFQPEARRYVQPWNRIGANQTWCCAN